MTSPLHQVELDPFHGPLDLLVQLVRDGEIDVLEVAIAEVMSQFLGRLLAELETPIDDAGEFLVLASTLMELKSRRLLPATTQESDENEDEVQVRHDLVRHLLEYRRFKEASVLLWQRAQEQSRKLSRRANGHLAQGPLGPPTLRGLELWDLVSAFSRLVKEQIIPAPEEVLRDPTPIHVYMRLLEEAVVAAGRCTLTELLGLQNSKPQLIGKFLALLELVKAGRVWFEYVEQDGDVVLLPPRSPAGSHQSTEGVPAADMADDSADDAGTVETEATSTLAMESPEPSVPLDAAADRRPTPSRAGAWGDFEPIERLAESAEPPADGRLQPLESPDIPPDGRVE